jgi:Bacterial SH3 domain
MGKLRNNMKKAAPYAILAFWIFIQAFPCSGGQIPSTVLKVKVAMANVRLEPSPTSEVVARVSEGTLLEAKSRTGDWYLVSLPPDEQNKIISGYIHSGTVDIVGPEKTQTVAPPEPVRAKVIERETERSEVIEEPPAERSRGKLLYGFFLKLGGMFSPYPGKFSDAWLASFGLDLGLNRNFSLGFEIQPAYRNFSGEETSFWIIPIMVLGQLKAALDLGNLTPSLGFARLFMGGGAGVEASYSVLQHMEDTFTKFETKPAYRVLAGTEIVLKSLRLIFEYQMTMISDPNVDPDFWGHYLLFGLRF